MSASATHIANLRRMVAEPTTATYSDALLAAAIERYPLDDADGYEPDNTAWDPTYDLHAAAADVWEEKAAAVLANYDYTADGHTLNRGQVADRYMRAANRHRARRTAHMRTQIHDLPDTDDYEVN